MGSPIARTVVAYLQNLPRSCGCLGVLLALSLVATSILPSRSLPALTQTDEPGTASKEKPDRESDEARRRARLLVSPAELAKQLGKDDVRVLDVRTEDDFREGHIPGALRIDVGEWKDAIRGGKHEDAEFWAKELGKLGITRDTRAVVYGAEPVTPARAWWTLAYVGVRKPALLDGGLALWKSEGHPISKEESEVAEAEFEPKFDKERLARAIDVRAALGDRSCVILDARTEGEVGRGVIPGAHHLDWADLVDEKGRYRSIDELQKLFEARGVAKEKTMIPYCQSGGRAAVDAFALELAGFGPAKTYAGSWGEWSADRDAPIGKAGEDVPEKEKKNADGGEAKSREKSKR